MENLPQTSRMSFRIRPLYKSINQANNPKEDIEAEDMRNTVSTHEDTQKILTAIKNFTQRSSHDAMVSPNDLREALKTSSINPETNPSSRSSVAAMLKNKEEAAKRYVIPENALAKPSQDKIIGFSEKSLQRFVNGDKKALFDLELQKTIDGALARESKSEASDQQEAEAYADDFENEEAAETAEDAKAAEDAEAHSAEKKKAASERASARRAMANSYPARASMLRGIPQRTTSTSGGIRRTVIGSVDAY